MSRRPTRVECYDCHEYVPDLKTHRFSCSKRKSKPTRNHFDTIRCFDCGERVVNLQNHRVHCKQSRKAKSDLFYESTPSVEQNNLIHETTTMFTLLDVSASMGGSRLQAAKESLRQCFNLMKDEDRFSIITFDTKPYFKLKPRPVEQIRRQGELDVTLGKIFAQGCTALYDAIFLAIDQIHDKSLHNSLVVLTDGEDNSSKRTMNDVRDLLAKFPNIRLDIIHINDQGLANPAYETICSEKGTYQVITTEQIITVTTTRYLESYNSK